VELNDVSAEMPLPPVGSVTDTSASNDWQKSDSNPIAKTGRLQAGGRRSAGSTQCCAAGHKSAPLLVRRGADLSALITLFKRSLLS